MFKIKMVFGSILILTLLFFTVNCGNKNKGSNAKAEESYSNANDSPEPVSSAPEMLIVKGLYIGMPAEESYQKALEIDKQAVMVFDEGYYFFSPNLKILYKPNWGGCFSIVGQKTEEFEYIPFKSIKYSYIAPATTEAGENGVFHPAHQAIWGKNLETDKYFIEVLTIEGKDDCFHFSNMKVKIQIENNKVTALTFTCDVFNACDMTGDSFAQEFINNYHIPKLEPVDGLLGRTSRFFESDFGWKLTVSGNEVMIEKITSKSERKFD